MTIYLASDHAGFALKEKLKKHLAKLGYDVNDMGNHKYEEGDDYPDWIFACAEAVAADIKKGGDSKAIILGGSGQGEAIVANRVRGIRAAVFYGGNFDIIKLSREHNDANILSLGARFLSEDEAQRAVALWLETPFSNEERHKKRIQKIKELES